MPVKPSAGAQPSRVGLAFGSVLREIRQLKGMSQEALALDVGIDRTYVSMLERGLRQPTLATILELAEILGVSADEMVRRTADLLDVASAPKRRVGV